MATASSTIYGAGAYLNVGARNVKHEQSVYVRINSQLGSDHCAFVIRHEPGTGYRILAISTLSLSGVTSWQYQPRTAVHLELTVANPSGAVTFWKNGVPVCTTAANSSFASGVSTVQFGSRAGKGDRLLRAAISGAHLTYGAIINKSFKLFQQAPGFNTNSHKLYKTNGNYHARTPRPDSVILEQV